MIYKENNFFRKMFKVTKTGASVTGRLILPFSRGFPMISAKKKPCEFLNIRGRYLWINDDMNAMEWSLIQGLIDDTRQ